METGNNFKTKFIREIELKFTGGTIDKYRKVSFEIPKPENIYKKGFCNIRCNHQELIDEIELDIGGWCTLRQYNTDCLIFPKLRQIMNITDSNLIPCFQTNEFFPYLEINTAEIRVRFNNLVNDNNIDDIIFTCDEMVIDDDNLIPTFQYYSTTKMNECISANPKFTPSIRYKITFLEFPGGEIYGIHPLAKYKLNFNNIYTIVIYTPNNKVSYQRLQIDGYNVDNTAIDIQYQFTTIQLKESIYVETCAILDLKLENVKQQEIYIYNIGNDFIEINNGSIKCIYNKSC